MERENSAPNARAIREQLDVLCTGLEASQRLRAFPR